MSYANRSSFDQLIAQWKCVNLLVYLAKETRFERERFDVDTRHVIKFSSGSFPADKTIKRRELWGKRGEGLGVGVGGAQR